MSHLEMVQTRTPFLRATKEYGEALYLSVDSCQDQMIGGDGNGLSLVFGMRHHRVLIATLKYSRYSSQPFGDCMRQLVMQMTQDRNWILVTRGAPLVEGLYLALNHGRSENLLRPLIVCQDNLDDRNVGSPMDLRRKRKPIPRGPWVISASGW